jgi:hypothetical protein
MVRVKGRGVTIFPRPASPALGNNLPANTGAPWAANRPGPGGTALGSGGQLGGNDGMTGTDPRVGRIQPRPVFLPGQNPLNSDTGAASDRQSYWRGGIQGFNDKLTVKDRHAYWDTGNQKTGLDGFGPAGSPNAYNDPLLNPPAPELRTVNRTVSYQKGSDATRHQDDLTRGYTWLGEQGSGWTRVNGGVPGLYSPYGSRGGFPYPLVSSAEYGSAKDGPALVWAGPPHGLHTQTPWKGGAQIIARTRAIPQMRPVRFDRPSNSPQAGQSYSQTVRPQGATGRGPRGAGAAQAGRSNVGGSVQGRGWSGRLGGS